MIALGNDPLHQEEQVSSALERVNHIYCLQIKYTIYSAPTTICLVLLDTALWCSTTSPCDMDMINDINYILMSDGLLLVVLNQLNCLTSVVSGMVLLMFYCLWYEHVQWYNATGFIKAWLSRMRSQTTLHENEFLCSLWQRKETFMFFYATP